MCSSDLETERERERKRQRERERKTERERDREREREREREQNRVGSNRMCNVVYNAVSLPHQGPFNLNDPVIQPTESLWTETPSL